MRRKTAALGILSALILLLGGCGSKQYYEPEIIEGDREYSGDLPARIRDVARNGATLENGGVITSAGVQDVQLPENYVFLNHGGGYIAATDRCGKFALFNAEGDLEKEWTFTRDVASVAIRDELIAFVFSDNTVSLRKISDDTVLFEENGEATRAHDAISAAPFFLKDLILFPTLDGKVIILDADTYKPIRNIVVNSDAFFNNVIFLEVFQNRLVAATQKKVISVSPDIINTYEAGVRDILFLRDSIYVLTKDGRIVKTDLDLNVQKERKFPFAHFVGIAHGEYIYTLEKQGFLIAVDPDLNTQIIYETPDEIDAKVFATPRRIFYDDRYFDLRK